MSEKDKTRQIYDTLKGGGGDVGSYQEFFNWFYARGKQGYANRKKTWDALHQGGADVGKNYEEFARRLGLHPMSQPTAKAAPARKATGTATGQWKMPENFVENAMQSPQYNPGANNPRNTYGTRKKMQPQQPKIHAPGSETDKEKKRQERVMRLRKDQMDYIEATGKPLKNPIELGVQHDENGNVVTAPLYAPSLQRDKNGNIATGENGEPLIGMDTDNDAREAYKTSLQDKVDVDKSREELKRQLEEAYKTRDELDEKLRARRRELEDSPWWQKMLAEMGKAAHSGIDPNATANDPEHMGYENDEEYMQLMSAARKNHQTIQTLEDKRDGKMDNFWHALNTTATNGYTFNDGLPEMRDVTALNNAKKHIDAINRKRQKGLPLTREEQVAEAVLKANENDDTVQSQYGADYGKWSRDGAMTINSIDYMKDFLLMPGGEGMAKAIAGKIASVGGKVLAKEAGESVLKAVPKAIARATLKATGVLVGAHTAGSVISNITGMGRTAALMGETSAGNVTKDEKGNYKIENEEGLMHALASAERTQMRENGSEMAGAFLPGGKFLGGLFKKGLEKIGLSKVSNFLTQMGNKEWYKRYSQFLKTGGYNGIPGEAFEEYEGELFDALTGHADEAWKDFTDAKQNTDIWLGCATMGALMGAIPMGIHMGGYYKYRHDMNKADKVAAFRMTQAKWEPLKEELDNTDNGNMADVVTKRIVMNNDLNQQEKVAALNYVRGLTNFRGFNIAQASNAGDEEDQKNQGQNEAYRTGYNAVDGALTDGQQTDGQTAATPSELDIKVAYAQARDGVAGMYGEDFVRQLDDDPDAALAKLEDESLGRQKAQAYVDAKAMYDGMIQRARDDMDDRVQTVENEVDSHVNPVDQGGDGMIHHATLKEKNDDGTDRKVYIVSGNVQMTADGTMVDKEKSSPSIVIRDPQTGETKMLSPADILSVDEPIDSEQERREAADAARQEFAAQRADRIDGLTPMSNPGQNDDVWVKNENGEPVHGVVTQVDPVTGEYFVQTDTAVNGKMAQPFQAGQLYEMATPAGAAAKQQPAEQTDGSLEEEQPTRIPDRVNEAQTQEKAPQEQQTQEEAPQEQPQRAIDRIPGQDVDDGKGNVRTVHNWEQADPGDTYDALTEIYHGNADRVKKGVQNRINAIDKQMKATQKQMDAIDNSDDFDAVAAQGEKYDQLQQQKNALEQQKKYWQGVQNVPASRRAVQDRRTEAEKAAAKAEREKAEEEAIERARQERERVNGVPDVANDAPSDARKRGFRNVYGMVVNRQGNTEGVTGRESSVKFSSKDTAKGKVKVIEADSLQPSHVNGQRNPQFFIDEAQPKDRTDTVSSMAAAKIASSLNPEEITGDGSAYQFSAPTVNSRGEVIQGNNRSDALKLMYSTPAFKPAQDAYKQYIIDHASDFGFTPEDVERIKQMKRPVMVNELDVDDDEAIRLGQMKASDNESGGIERIDPVTTSQKLGSKVRNYANILLSSPDEDASLSDVLMQNGSKTVHWLSSNGVISDTAAQSAFDRKGNLTPEARMDLLNVLKQSLFQGGVSDLRTMFGRMPAKAQKAILNTFMRDFDSAESERVLPEIQKSIEAWYGCANASEAFAKAPNYKAAKAAMHDWTLQTNMLDDNMPSDRFSNFAMELACRLQGCSMRETQQSLNDFFDLVQGKSQGDLFGGTTMGEQADRQEAIRRVFDIDYKPIKNKENGKNGSNAVADDNSQSGEGRPGSTRDGAGRERAAGAGQQADVAGGTEGNDEKGINAGAIRTKDGGYKKLPTGYAYRITDAQEVTDVINNGMFRKMPDDMIVPGSNKVYTSKSGRKFSFGKQAGNTHGGKAFAAGMPWGDNGNGGTTSGGHGEKYFIAIPGNNIDGWRVGHHGHYSEPRPFDEIEEGKGLWLPFDEDGDVADLSTDGMRVFKKVGDTYYEVEHPEDIANNTTQQAAQPIGPTSSQEHVKTEREAVNTEPTEKQKEAGNYKKGHIKVDGFDITIENPKGSTRSGKDASGKTWSVPMHYDYGYIKGTEGVDGDHIDVYLSDDPTKGNVYVVDQVNQNDGSFDEHKVMYGFPSTEAAVKAYKGQYEDGWKVGTVTEVSREDFKKWVESSKRKTKPFADYKSMEAAAKQQRTEPSGKQKTEEKPKAKAKRTTDKKETEKPKKANAGQFGLVSDERMEELKKRLRAKLNNLNMGVDPEVLAIGLELTAGYIDRGVKKFAEYSKAMINDLGDVVRPYLKAFYNGVRDMPEITENGLDKEMDDYDTVSRFNVATIGKDGDDVHPSILDTAEQVSNEKAVEKKANKQMEMHQVDVMGLMADLSRGRTTSLNEHFTDNDADADTKAAHDNMMKQLDKLYRIQGRRAIEGIVNDRDNIIDFYKGKLDNGETQGEAYGSHAHVDYARSLARAIGEREAAQEFMDNGFKTKKPLNSQEESNHNVAGTEAWTDADIDALDLPDAVKSKAKAALHESGSMTDHFALVEARNKAEEQKKSKPVRYGSRGFTLRPARQEDFEGHTPFYVDGKQVHAVMLVRTGEQVSATQFSAPRVEAIYTTTNERVPVEKLEVEDVPTTVHLKSVGDFYETYGNDAVALGHATGVTVTQRGGGMKMAGFPKSALKDYEQDMLDGGFNVAIDGKLTAKSIEAEKAAAKSDETQSTTANIVKQMRGATKAKTSTNAIKNAMRGKKTEGKKNNGTKKAVSSQQKQPSFFGSLFGDEESSETNQRPAELDLFSQQDKPAVITTDDEKGKENPVEQHPAKELSGESKEYQERAHAEKEFVDRIKGMITDAAKEGKSLTMSDIKKAYADELDDNWELPKYYSDTDLQELVERAMTLATREVAIERISKNNSDAVREGYDMIVKLYESQPSLNARDSTRVAHQQYSTPTPFGYVMDWYLRNGKTPYKGLEPSAGNGALTIGFPAVLWHVNDIDERRLMNLRTMPYGKITNQDGTLPFEPKAYDMVATNPPFGSTQEKTFDGGRTKISSLEGLMAINALASMKDNGRAAIIIGGNTQYMTNGAMQSKDMKLFRHLYTHYNVVDVINLDGDMYKRNGTGYNVRMILIAGRKTDVSENPEQFTYPPVKRKARAEQVRTFDELFKRVEDDIQQAKQMEREPAIAGRSDESQRGQRASERTGNSEAAGGVLQRPVRAGAMERRTQPGRSLRPSAAQDGRGEGERGQHGGTYRLDHADGRDAGSNHDVPGHGPAQGQSRERRDSGSLGRGTVGGTERGGAPERTDTDGGRLDVTGNSAAAQQRPTEPSAPREKVELGQEKVAYPNKSQSMTLQSRVPAAQAEAIAENLDRLGDVDEMVRSELGYSSKDELFSHLAAEQIDSVALAIDQMKHGKGFIIGDMTGVGKGRQGAALIRWAVRQGKTPIYFTQKARLFTDNYRDMCDIGSKDLRPFIIASNKDGNIVEDDLNANGEKQYDKDGNVKTRIVHGIPKKAEYKRVYDYIKQNGKLPSEYDYVLVTYSQIQSGTSVYEIKDNGTIEAKDKKYKGKPQAADLNGDIRRDVLETLAKNNYVFLDESHTVGGQSTSGLWMQTMLNGASGVTYLSATFAKRPDNMPLYAMKTAMSESGLSQKDMIDAINKGGVTLQEIMSRQLVQSGQMIRRERDFTGVTIDWEGVEDEADKKQRAQFDEVAKIFNAIREFQDTYVDPAIADMSEQIAEQGQYAQRRQGTSHMGVNNVPFASKMYNLVNQLLFSLKTDAVADKAIEQLKAGKKPVISFSNTMEGFLDELPKNTPMDELPDFSLTLMKALEGTLRYTEGESGDRENQIKKTLNFKDLGEEAQEKYNEIRRTILNLSSGLPIDPMDAIKMRIESAGYKVGEITGRKTEMVRDADGRYIVRSRSSKDMDGKAAASAFNSASGRNGGLDVLLINKSGSTGISLHASSKFADQSPRVMIAAQFQSDINDEVQMRGRIDRTGQVHRGQYIYLVSSIPAEQRLQMMFKNKLKSLDANTTSSQKSKFNEMDVTDFMNKYGDEVTWSYMMEHPDLEERLGDPLDMLADESKKEKGNRRGGDDESNPKNGCAAKILRRLPFLSVTEQENIFKEISEAYKVKLQLLNDAGENDLEITTMPLRADTKQKKIWKRGSDPESGNAFADNTYLEQVEVDVLKKPMKADEVRAYAERLTDGKSWEQWRREQHEAIDKYFNEKKIALQEKADESAQKRASRVREDYIKGCLKARKKGNNTWSDQEIGHMADVAVKEFMDKERAKSDARTGKIDKQVDTINSTLDFFTPLEAYIVPLNLTDAGSMLIPSLGTFIGIKFNKSFSTASSTAVFATLDGRRKVELPLGETKSLEEIRRHSVMYSWQTRDLNMDNWDEKVPTKSRKTAYIVTGNLMQALVDTQKDSNTRGQIISYTTIDGDVRQGILMNDRFNADNLRTSAPISSMTDEIKQGNTVESENGEVKIEKSPNTTGWYKLMVPKSKQRGGKYFLDKKLLKMMADGEFTTKGNAMVSEFKEADLKKVLDYLSKQLGVTVLQKANLEAAEDNDIPSTPAEAEEGDVLYREVDDDEQKRLDSEPTVKVYRAMQLINGKLYPPMAAKVNGSLVEPAEPGQWLRADEHPELAKNGLFTLNKGGKDASGKRLGSVPAAYNPYWHTSRSPLNDQFSSAYKRPNLVTVEVEIPKSELTSGYHADGAKDPVGEMSWHAGPVSSKLPKEKERKVILSRWCKVVRVVPDAEVADKVAGMLKGENISVPDNTVTPSLRRELEKRGVPITHTKMVEDWERKYPSTQSGLSREGNGAYSDDELSMINDPFVKMLGEKTRTAKQRKAFAARERRRMEAAAHEWADKLHLDNVEIVSSNDRSTRRGRAKGYYDKATGKIVVNINNHQDVQDVIQTILHEAVGHYGLRQLFGQHFNTFLENVYAAADMDVRRRITELALRKYKGDFHVATEEYLASLAEDTNYESLSKGFWPRIKQLFLRMLRAIGLKDFVDRGVTLSDNELRYILWRSFKNLTAPGEYRSFADEAEDVAKQAELKVGDFRLDKAIDQGASPEELAVINKTVQRSWLAKKAMDTLRQLTAAKRELDEAITENPSSEKASRLRGQLEKLNETMDDNRDWAEDLNVDLRQLLKDNGVKEEDLREYDSRQAGIDAAQQRPTEQSLNEQQEAAEREAREEKVRRLTQRFVRTFRQWLKVKREYDRSFQEDPESERTDTLGDVLNGWNDNMETLVDEAYEMGLDARQLRQKLKDNGTEDGDLREYDGLFADEEVPIAVDKNITPEQQALLRGHNFHEYPTIQELSDAKLVNNVESAVKKGENVSEPEAWGKKDLLSKAEQVSHGIEPDLLFRDSIEDDDDTARETYDRMADEKKNIVREAWQDSMINVRNLQEAVMKQRGEKLEDWEDAYNEENRMHGRSRAESEYFTDNLYKPLLRAVNAVAKAAKVSVGDVTEYMMAKHGLERNEVFARRDGQAAWEKYKEREQGEYYEYQTTHPNGNKTLDDFMDKSYDDFYNHYREKDYSGLTSLTGTDNVQDAEAEAQRIVADMEGRNGVEPYTTKLWKATNESTGWTLKKAYESGMMSRDNYDLVRSMFSNYIPLRGWEEDTAGDLYDYVGSGDKGTAFSPTLHKAKGRRSQADNPIAYIGSMAVSAIVQGNKNKVKQTFMRFAENHPTNLVTVSEMWYRNYGTDTDPDWREDVPYIPEDATADEIAAIVKQHEDDMEQLEAQGMATKQRGRLHLGVPVKKGQALEHHVEVILNGKKYVLYINGNPRAAQALNGTRMRRSSERSFESSKIAAFGRKLAERYTSLSPSFTVSNMLRDLTMAAISTSIKESPAYALRFRLNVARLGGPARMFTLMRWYKDFVKKNGVDGANGLNGLSKTQLYFYEFMTHGAETGFTSLKEIEAYKDDMQKMYKHMNQSLANPWRLLRGLSEGLEYTNRCIEDMTRFATYMASRQSGRSVRESTSDAKNITLNFNRKGSGELGNSTYRNLQIFVNPAIQSLQNVASMAMDHPVKFSLYTGMVALIGAAQVFATQLLWSMFGGGDGDDDKWNAVDEYWKLPTWQRRNNLVMWIPGTKKFAMIPLAQEFRVFHGFGETLTTTLQGKSDENPALELMSQTADLLPLDFAGNNGNMLVNLAPTVTQPLLQVGFNTDFTGRPLYKDNSFNKYEPSFQKAYVGTPSWLVKSSEILNDLTGGDAHKQGWWERTKVGQYANNPAVVDHLLKGYYGGMYSFLAQTGGAMLTAASGKVPDVQEVPVANRVVTAVRVTEQSGKQKLPDWYYEMSDDSKRYQSEVSGYRRDMLANEPGAKQHFDMMVKTKEFEKQEQIKTLMNTINQIRAAQSTVEDPKTKEDAQTKQELSEGLQTCLGLLDKIRKEDRPLTDKEMGN
ncbi:MAG: strawberry notch C-terminal domain-containing protein [Bacteroidales bacterium]|nr:strawberry notch C-terminal domain-containing protein [Bacteroidales bacterium]